MCRYILYDGQETHTHTHIFSAQIYKCKTIKTIRRGVLDFHHPFARLNLNIF